MNTDNYDKLRERMIKELAMHCKPARGCGNCSISKVVDGCLDIDWPDMTDQQLTAAMQAAGLRIETDEEARKEKIKQLVDYCDELGKRDIPCEDCIIQRMCMPIAGRSKQFGHFSDDELDEAVERIQQDEAVNRKLEEHTAAKPDMVNQPNHYQLPGGLECWDVMVAMFGAEEVKIWAKINAFTYLFRHAKKNGEEDIRKALVNLQKYFELGE